MSRAIQYYRILNVLSIDVVAGALICALFFAKIFAVTLSAPVLLALGFTVWIIYTTDHLRDAKRIHQQASTARHRFHQRYFSELVTALVLFTVLDGLSIAFLPRPVLLWGIVLSVAVAAYLLVHRHLKMLKEISIAIMYTSGILLPSFSIASPKLQVSHYILIFQFFVLALINLLMFSWFDRALDEQDRQPSFATTVGDHAARRSLWLLILLEVLLTLLQQLLGDLPLPSLVLGSMGVLLLAIFVFRGALANNDFHRFLGDAVFIFPLVYLL